MGGKKATTTSKVTIPPEVLERYNAVNKQAEEAAKTPYEAFGNTASDYVAQLNARQYSGFDDINTTAGSYQPYLDAAGNATTSGMGPAYEGIDRYMSPYIKNVADTTGALLKQQYEQAQSGALGTAASSGAFGGDRAGIAAANIQQQNQLGYGKTMADIYNQGYTQALGASQADLARELQGGAQMAELGAESQRLGLQGAQAKIAAGTMEQQTEQAGKDAMIERFMQEKGYPFQVAQYLANIAMGTGAASGSTTSTTTPRNWLGFASGGGVSGYANGGGVAGPRTYSQGQIGGQGYVPAGDLPVGQLMVAQPPEQQQGNGTEEIVKLISTLAGAKRGGVIDQRHGYALDGGVKDAPVWNAYTRKYEVGPNTPVEVEPPTGVKKDATGVVIPPMHPDRQFSRGIPLLTQADYVMSEPEFKNYTSRTYKTPAEAAVGANDYYEMAGKGVGDAAAIQHANRIYGAIQNGGEGLAPNELTLYNHYKENGFTDDIQLAGLIGRFNVEAGEGINPNARNTLGGGYGTYGIMQARGPRFEGLAAAGGMTPEMLEAMPVTHGLSSGVAGGDNVNTSISTMGAPDEKYAGGVKPYEDRNFIGKFFHNRDGSLNSNAIMSLLGGLAKGAEAQTISPLGGILSGLGGGMETYKALVKQAADVEATNLANVQNAMKNYSYAVYNGMTDLSWPEYAKQQGIDLSAVSGMPGMIGQPPMDPITVADTRSVVTRNVNGVDYQIPFMQDLQSLNDLINRNVGAQSDPSNPMSQVVQQAIAARDQIMASGSTTDVDGNKVEVPAAIRAQNQSASTVGMQQDREKFRDQGIDAAAQISTMSNTIGNMEKTLTDYGAGSLAGLGHSIGALLQFTGANMDAMPDFLQNPEKYTVAAKDAALLQRSQLESIPGGAPAASIQFTNTFTPTPDMPPAAVRELLINMKAGNEYLRQYYEGFPEWAAKNPNQETDIQAYQEEFSKGRDQRYKDIVKDFAAKTPHFKGDVPPGVDETWFNSLSLRRQQETWALYDRGLLTSQDGG
jgi:hypothetical protein